MMEFVCPYCDKLLPRYYNNKGTRYYGDRGRYNYRGAKANANRHFAACEKRATPEKREEVRQEENEYWARVLPHVPSGAKEQ